MSVLAFGAVIDCIAATTDTIMKQQSARNNNNKQRTPPSRRTPPRPSQLDDDEESVSSFESLASSVSGTVLDSFLWENRGYFGRGLFLSFSAWLVPKTANRSMVLIQETNLSMLKKNITLFYSVAMWEYFHFHHHGHPFRRVVLYKSSRFWSKEKNPFLKGQGHFLLIRVSGLPFVMKAAGDPSGKGVTGWDARCAMVIEREQWVAISNTTNGKMDSASHQKLLYDFE